MIVTDIFIFLLVFGLYSVLYVVSKLDIKPDCVNLSPRESYQPVSVAYISKFNDLIGLHPVIGKETRIKKMIEWGSVA